MPATPAKPRRPRTPKNRLALPERAPDAAPVAEFAPVPRKARHDGWTPERQRAFIAALADTGCVSRAAAMVNMAQTNCYTLRRAPGAEGFRRAWDAALDFGLQRLKDVAFERAIEGQLVPVFVAGKLMGFRRKRNDALLMFCLRHYGQDAGGKRTTINYFSTRASAVASAAAGGGAGASEASTTTLRTVVSGGAGDASHGAARVDALAQTIEAFAGVELDAEAQAAVEAAVLACAVRRRGLDAALDQGGEGAADAGEYDPEVPFVSLPRHGSPYRGELVPLVEIEDAPDEPLWVAAEAEEAA